MGETGKGRVFVALHSVNKVFGEKTTTTAITIPEAKHNSVAVSLARLGSARFCSALLRPPLRANNSVRVRTFNSKLRGEIIKAG